MTTFAKGRRARHLPLPRHEHIKPIDGTPDDDPIEPEILALAAALARGLARMHHAAESGGDDG